MSKTALSLLGALLLSGTITVPAGAETAAEMDKTLNTLFGHHEPYAAFLIQIKKAIAADNRDAVARLVDYPLPVHLDGKAVKIKGAQEFVAHYAKLVTPRVKQAVARQSYPTLFANWQGVSVGDGTLWFAEVGNGRTVKIIAINP
ncbi:hypothetical protein [Candidatus Methylocalor cossyra]|uniref:Nuclear transport factor 2 family protein n=1 Tax=Candidatus Methylocalor cossyra TaxID=3108543 RepID=A0ABM9NL81_9GAMM